ncbi:MAG: alpha/beta hydrolase [Clostridium sp.]|uniref:poly(ethylene terephthalate) hydrolase family protein n=1 Tax=Clostridium sp. TaxID=1506 RepID=UPI002A91D1B2|nr:alpha/beta hydrolase [Clostridium sp.]MDY6227656.1 alpha/beta hydrolase [Clostridium sp.]
MIRLIKKIIKIILLILLTIILVLFLLYLYKDNAPVLFNGYNKKIEICGELEYKYLQSGKYETSHTTVKAEKPMKKYTIYYPSELQSNDKKYPVVFIANGTGFKATMYKPLYEHLASWGFIVIGNQDKGTGTGESTSKTLDYILEENENKDSLFYNKIDTDNIGITGFSQGGAAVFRAITMYENSKYFKTAVPLSPVNEKTANEVGYPYDLTKVNIPIMMLAGTSGEFETDIVIPIESMKIMYDKINSFKVMARRSGANHDMMMYHADGYVTAWMMWQLQGDNEAKNAFIGDNPELLANKMYQDQQINLDNE